MLLLPQGADQFDNAAACAAIGTAIVLRLDVVASAAAQAAVRSLRANAAPRAAAESVAREIASMPSPEHVVPRLTGFASATRPPS